jgi:hypothetical protein
LLSGTGKEQFVPGTFFRACLHRGAHLLLGLCLAGDRRLVSPRLIRGGFFLIGDDLFGFGI